MNIDSLALVLYALAGMTLLLLGLQLWHIVHKGGESPLHGDPTIGVHLIDPASANMRARREWLWEKLTRREMEVAELIAEGKRNAEIAETLSISIRTVDTHIQNIYEKLEVHSRTQLSRVIRDLVE